MDAILETLYSTFAPDRVSEAERAIMEREGEFLDGVEERLSVEDFGHLWDVFLDMSLVRMEESFTLGYRLGAQLMLASLGTEEWAIDPQKRPYSWHSPVEPGGSYDCTTGASSTRVQSNLARPLDVAVARSTTAGAEPWGLPSSGSRQKKMLPSPVLAGREHDEPVILRGATHIRRGPSRDGALFRPFLARGTSRGRLRPRSSAVLPPVLSAGRFQRSAAALSVRWTGILCRRHGGAAIFSYYRPLSTEKSMGML